MNQKYNLVNTVEKLKELDQILMNGESPRYEILSYDTETNGLRLHVNTMVGFSISFNEHSGYYIPLLQWVPDPESVYNRKFKKVDYKGAFKNGSLKCVWTGEVFPEFVTPKEYDLATRFPLIPALLNRWLTGPKLIMHNAPFDINMTYICTGIETKNNLLCDTGLLVHILNENEPTALKKCFERYKDALGINYYAEAAIEKKELDRSIIMHGGKPGEVWRASLEFQNKYACADTFKTFGLFRAALSDFANKFGERGMQWFFHDEVMPVCKEVVIDMKRNGVFIDVPYFEKIHQQNLKKMNALEDELQELLTTRGFLKDFPLGKSVKDTVSPQRFIKKIIELEGLSIPTKLDKKTGERKETLAKGEVKKAYQKDPHWVWGYILGEDELKYSEKKIEQIEAELYQEVTGGKRYRFNINSRDHIEWLFCDKLGLKKTSLPQTDSATKDKPKAKMDAEILTEHMLPRWEWVSKILTWRKLEKLQSSYILPAINLNVNGWLYMDMKQNGTTSGRFSCSGGFNLQTLPRVDDELELLENCTKCESSNVEVSEELMCIADVKCLDCGHLVKDIVRPSAIKQGFVTPPGMKIINADYSSLEPRCFAFVSNEDKLKQVYWDGLDLYSKVYCDIFDVEKQYSANPKDPNFLKKVAKAKRTWIKPIVLGIPYGAEESQVANLIGAKKQKVQNGCPVFDEDGQPVMLPDITEGRRVRNAYLETYPKLSEYMEEQDEKAVTLGYVETLLGRRRHLPFAKKINDVLVDYDIHWKDLVHAPIWELKKGMSINYTSLRGNKVRLTEDMLRRIQSEIGFKDEKLPTKGYWAFIRSMLRGDLNNAKNNPIQGLAGHIANKGMLEATRKFRARGINSWICLQVHDEITGYAAQEQAAAAAECLQLGMEKNNVTALLDLDMIAEPVICDNLKESK